MMRHKPLMCHQLLLFLSSARENKMSTAWMDQSWSAHSLYLACVHQRKGRICIKKELDGGRRGVGGVGRMQHNSSFGSVEYKGRDMCMYGIEFMIMN